MREFAPGLYDEVVVEAIAAAVSSSERFTTVLPTGDITPYLVRHFARVAIELCAVANSSEANASVWDVANRMLQVAEGHLPPEAMARIRIELPARILREVAPESPALAPLAKHPSLGLTRSHLLANFREQARLYSVIREELQSAERVQIIMAFIRRSGVAVLRESLKNAIDRGCPIELITSVYTRGSEARAIEDLYSLGVSIRINLDHATSTLHAKGWLFERASGYGTAIIGSSNISSRALSSGQEWNLRVVESETPHLIEAYRKIFNASWHDPKFVAFDIEQHSDELRDSLSREGFPSPERILTLKTLTPRAHQVEALEALTVQRTEFQRHRNLIVAATGTGKTVMAALDYARQCRPNQPRPTLLFVAHRQEILQQALQTFRDALGDRNFGELFTGGHHIEQGTHVFASVQLLARRGIERTFRPDYFQIVIIDEFHHAAAPSYRDLLTTLAPKELLGLTATPERSDGIDVASFFDGRVAFEIRLGEALREGLLVPFNYFGVSDGTDLSGVAWSRAGYDAADLQELYVGNEGRLRTIFNALDQYIDDLPSMRALGFCVSIKHAEYMASAFDDQGIPSVFLTGSSDENERREAIARLESGKIQAIFTVDLFNEGVDIPIANTLLMLRPTQSIPLFTQQLGRGLRLAERKDVCIVLDFIGQHRRDFDVTVPLAVMSNSEEAALDIDRDFPTLPPGCLIHLEPVAKQTILRHLQQQKRAMGRIELVIDQRPLSLAEVLDTNGTTIHTLYGQTLKKNGLVRAQSAQLPGHFPDLPYYRPEALLHFDDSRRIQGLRNLASRRAHENSDAVNRMILARLSTETNLEKFRTLQEAIDGSPSLQEELRTFAEHLERGNPFTHAKDAKFPDLALHARYTRIEAMAALADVHNNSVRTMREGVYYNPDTNTDIFFVTINKDEKLYSEDTQYHDYPLGIDTFVWESQNSTAQTSRTGERYVSGTSDVVLFARAYSKIKTVTFPFYYLGHMRPLKAEGNRPIQLTYKLERPMPYRIYNELKLIR